MLRIIAIIFLCFIVVNLFLGLYHILRDKSGSTRAVRSLTIRVGLSIALFLIIAAAAHFGLAPER